MHRWAYLRHKIMAVTIFVICEEKQQVQDKTQQINNETQF